MISPRHGSFLFGDWVRSVLWACDLRAEADASPERVSLPAQQFVFVVPVTAPLRWIARGESGHVEPGHVLLLHTGEEEIGIETAGEADALLLGMKAAALTTLLEPFRPGLAPGVRDLVCREGGAYETLAKAEILSQVVPALRSPAVSGVARAFWYESQWKTLLALLCFVPAKGEEEFFCSRQKRLAQVRVQRAKAKLEARLDEALDLNRLSEEVGCSASYLSRTFSATTGMTISQYLRKRRIERAADLLVTGRYNVSEVAVEVGYQSLSHFSKAFLQEKGCLPSKYDLRARAA